jgi:hypothetical protein
MRLIKYKDKNSSEFKIYVDIESCFEYYDSFQVDHLPVNHEEELVNRRFDSYSSWFNFFKAESIGQKMYIIDYLLGEFMGWDEKVPRKDYFGNIFGLKTADVISSNLDLLLKFNNKWFTDFLFFNGLNLSWIESENFFRTEYSEEGFFTEIEFEDHSVIKFLDDNDTVNSCYVLEEDFHNLKNDIDNILIMFKP